MCCWERQDSNLRYNVEANLQSAAMILSATFPLCVVCFLFLCVSYDALWMVCVFRYERSFRAIKQYNRAIHEKACILIKRPIQKEFFCTLLRYLLRSHAPLPLHERSYEGTANVVCFSKKELEKRICFFYAYTVSFCFLS